MHGADGDVPIESRFERALNLWTKPVHIDERCRGARYQDQNHDPKDEAAQFHEFNAAYAAASSISARMPESSVSRNNVSAWCARMTSRACAVAGSSSSSRI